MLVLKPLTELGPLELLLGPLLKLLVPVPELKLLLEPLKLPLLLKELVEAALKLAPPPRLLPKNPPPLAEPPPLDVPPMLLTVST